ncbi:MAG: hypothetical protein HNEKOMLI_00082 [Sodalis sp. Psp]|nr:hypothetical protein [Sodalis sp. Psp]MCR3756587.1 hypothetical protein [Sodalis sp. Ppy]
MAADSEQNPFPYSGRLRLSDNSSQQLPQEGSIIPHSFTYSTFAHYGWFKYA